MTIGGALVVAYEVERALFRVMLLTVIAKSVTSAWTAWRARERRAAAATSAAARDLPIVTVQLPIRNERFVAERVIRAAAALAYPADRLEIQVLDDSDDDTVDKIDRVVAELRARGVDISVLRRDHPDGAKAGALAYGTARARGAYLAVFDADFVPPADFLTRVLPAFEDDPKIGMVQGRWAFLNRGDSALTHAQAVVLDGLMLVDQAAKSARHRPLHFNGTAGVWRRTCLDDAGGWRDDSITEDVELSFRAIRRGWRMVHLPALAVPTELPRTMRAYRAQQQRWTRGNAQVLRMTAGQILGARLSLRDRAAMVMQLGSRVLYVFLAILTITMPLTTFGWMPWLVNYGATVDAALLAVVLAALLAFYVPAQRLATGAAWRGVVLVPIVIALHVGLSMCCAVAFVAGLVVKGAAFVRTPKLGSDGNGDGADPAARVVGPAYRVPFAAIALVELAIGGAYLAFAALAVHRQLWLAAIFFAFWACAHLWTSAATIVER